MADEPLQQILDEMRSRIQAELDGQVQVLRAREAEAIARAREQADADADTRWSARVETVKNEWSARLESEITAARAEAEKRLVAEMMRIRGEADQEVATERERGAAQLDAERQHAAAELEAERQRAAARLDAERRQVEQQLDAAWSARLESEITAARAEGETRLVAEAMRIRGEADQVVATERERGAAQLDAERQHAAAELEAERQRAAARLDAERRQVEQQLDAARAAFEAERDQLEREAHARKAAGVEAESVLRAMRTIDAARSLSDALSSLVRGAVQHATRAALFVINGTRLDEWPVSGIEPLSHQPVELTHSGLLRAAITRSTRVTGPADGSAPSFAALPEGRASTAAPLVVDGQPIAVLYADEGPSTDGPERPGWVDAVELLARHGAACLAHLTAVRALQLLHGGNGQRSARAASVPDEEQSARRYAKLLVSEIKLYNEGAVRVGRERRDLLQRLKAEIERARRLYEERVSSTVTARASYFQQELIQTLAGGDPALLGS